jgi:hypothetical protein
LRLVATTSTSWKINPLVSGVLSAQTILVENDSYLSSLQIQILMCWIFLRVGTWFLEVLFRSGGTVVCHPSSSAEAAEDR